MKRLSRKEVETEITETEMSDSKVIAETVAHPGRVSGVIENDWSKVPGRWLAHAGTLPDHHTLATQDIQRRQKIQQEHDDARRLELAKKAK